ncbi:MAG: thiamine pyrophosphate-dependent enzyme [Pseudomonadota bacterium]
MTDTLSHLLCRGLTRVGVDSLYCLPGVQNDDFFNVLFDFPEIRPIVARHEQATSYMATGAALATGNPQAYCTVPGQGMLNAAAGHSTAFSAAARVFALVGQNRSDLVGQMHGLLHEIPDQMAVLGQISKQSEALRDPSAASGQIASAFNVLISGHPAPVTVECPVDLWSAEGKDAAIAEPAFPDVDLDRIHEAADLLASAKRPLVMLGGGAQDAAESIAALAEMLGAPVSALRQGKGAYDERRPLAVPGPVAHQYWAEADVVLGIGTRFQWQEMTWGTDDELKLIQITADPGELNRRGNIAVSIHAMTEHAVPKLVDALATRLPTRPDRTDDIAARKAAFNADLAELQPTVGDLAVIADVLGEDGVFVDDLTQVAYAARFAYPVPRPRGYVCAGYAGTLGWGVPAGLGVANAMLGRPVLTVQGDGGFLYGANELATAVKYKIPLVTLVYNDSAYGNVQRIQEQRFGHNRTIATDLVNPDMVKFAESFGALGVRAGPGPEGLRTALETAFASGGPAVVEVPVTERYPSPWKNIFLPTVRGEQQTPLLAAPNAAQPR